MGASNQSLERKRWYSLGARGGTMDGEPVFKEAVNIKPSPLPPPEQYEFRNDKHFMIWTDIQGTLEAITVEEREMTFNGRTNLSKRLYLVMNDNEGNFNVDLGDVTGRYAMNFMTRMLNQNINLAKEFRMSPYKLESKDGAIIAGVVVYQGGKKIDGMNKDQLSALGCPNADLSGKHADFMPPARWLFKKLKDRLMSVFVDSTPDPEPLPESDPLPLFDEEPQDKKIQAEALFGEPQQKEKPSLDEDDDLPF